jgi:hypothetical protein
MPKGRINKVSQVQLVNDFATKLKKNMTKLQLQNACNKLKTELQNITNNMNSLSTRYAYANQQVKKILGDKHYDVSFQILKPTLDEKKKQILDQKDSYVTKLSNRPTIEYKKYIQVIDSFKHSNNYNELLVCASLISGRRLTELAKTGKFTEVNDPQFVLFGGQLKKRKENTIKPYEIPLINIKSKEFIKIINKIRQLKDFSKKDNKTTISLINKGVNDIMKTAFHNISMTTETIRGCYGVICYNKYSDKAVSEALYIGKILGHEEGDLATASTHYLRTNIDMGSTSNDTIKLMLSKLDEVIALQRESLKSMRYSLEPKKE